MAASIYPEFPPQLESEENNNIVSTIKDWSIAHGLAVRPPPSFVSKDTDPESVLAVTAPVTLFPSPFPKAAFHEGLDIQKAYNELYAAIAQDEPWLERTVKEIVEVDDYIEKLWKVHLRVKQEGYVQDLTLGMFRSDYMVHIDPTTSSPKPQIKQVEFNTISSAFGGLSSRVTGLHKHLQDSSAYPSSPVLSNGQLPSNSATTSLVAGLAAAHEAYGASKCSPSLPTCVLFVIQGGERNIFDQRHLEYSLQSQSIPVFRLAFSDTLSQTSISSSNSSRPLLFKPSHATGKTFEVSTLYFRSTYAPTDLPTSESWEARYHLERSAAIKCPSILLHLAGTKKVQQVLATPNSPDLARFVPDQARAEAIRKTFAAIYPLDDSIAGQEAKKIALDPNRAEDYVLKPQREGGGNNIYRGAIPDFLKELGEEKKWRGHILMELIEPPSQRNTLFRDGVVRSGEVIAELGVYGTCLWKDNGKILHNEEAGYLLRTKGRESEEGGVAAGFGALDSVCLIDV